MYQDNIICPKCGSKMILRTARRGPYAGQDFYGCSNYPRCKEIFRSDEQSTILFQDEYVESNAIEIPVQLSARAKF